MEAQFTEIFRAALQTARACKVEPNETVVIFTDTEKDVRIVEAFYTAVSAITDPILIRTKSFPHLTDPHPLAVQAMSSANMVFDLASHAWLYTKATEKILLSGTRMLQINRDERAIIDRSPLESVIRRSQKGQEILSRCSTVRITSRLGGDLVLHRGQRPVYSQAGFVDENKSWDSYGVAQAAFAPIESQGDGNLFFNGVMSMAPHGSFYVEKPFEVRMEGGRITYIDTENVQGRHFKQWMDSWKDDNMYRVAHIGFGVDPRVSSLSRNPADTESMYGAITIAFGTNQFPFLKGANVAKSHTDVVLFNSSFAADSVWLIRDGEFTDESGLK